MHNFNEIIDSTENRWKPRLFTFCKKNFAHRTLPSHDEKHHARVWYFAKELLYTLSLKMNIRFSREFTEGLIIASYFHDSGMKYTRDEKHGKKSREICEEYFERNTLKKTSYFKEILKAIEHHDDKKNYNPVSLNSNTIQLLTILSIADDLDAFGYIGILRYAEIYLLRKVPVDNLAQKVLNNAEQRFRHFEKVFSDTPEFLEKQRLRYNILARFYESLNSSPANFKVITNIQNNIQFGQYNTLTDLIEPEDWEIKSFKVNLYEELTTFD